MIEPVADIDYGSAVIRMLLSLAACIGLLLLTIWLLRRLMQSRFHRSPRAQIMNILEKQALSPKSTLYLIEVHDQHMLVVESQHSVHMEPLIDNNRKMVSIHKPQAE